MKIIISVCLLFGVSVQLCMGQPELRSKESQDSLYKMNIKKTRIEGVYIPQDYNDAIQQLIKLTPKDALDGFKNAEEVYVCKKLHFGIGRWMIVNWKFYEGSRLSHYYKKIGLLHPDDMAQFTLRILHRALNAKPLEKEQLISELAEARKLEADKVIEEKEIIKRTKKDAPPDKKN